MSKNISLRMFSIIFGIFLMGGNAVSIIVPMRLADQGLSYDKIGVAMSMVALGILVVRPIVGRHSDLIGPKRYILVSLSLGCFALFFMTWNTSLTWYLILNCIVGLSRGIFVSVSSAYTVAISDHKKLGSSFGNLIGISTLFTCAGGVVAGVLYPIHYGSGALFLIAVIYACAFLVVLKWLPDTQRKAVEYQQQKLISANLFRGVDKHIYLFCFIVFVQQFTTGPLWNTFVPLHFYLTFAFSSTFVGLLMSLDELIGSPISFLAGKISDKSSDQVFLTTGYVLAGCVFTGIFFTASPIFFMVFFLISGCFVTCTQIVIPKAASGFMRENTRGFEFAIISTCGGIGEWLGNTVLGEVIKDSSINYAVLLYFLSYILIAIISFWGLKSNSVAPK